MEPPDFSHPVNYATAVQWAVARDPRVALAREEAEAAEGQIEQADLPPNPIFGFDMENFWGSGPVDGAEGIEVTFAASQVIETAGKQQRRTTLARRERELVDWRYELIIAGIEADVRTSFVQLLLAQETMELRQEQLALAEESARETTRLVEAARVPLLEQTRAELEIRKQRFALGQAERDLLATRTALAVLWGLAPAPEFTVDGEIQLEPELPVLREILGRLSETAMLAQYAALARTREAVLDLEKSNAAPDLEIFAGGRYFNEGDGDFGFIAGFEIPIPVFDRNQGNIRTARAQLRAVEHEREVTRRALLKSVSGAYQALTAAHAEAFAVQSELLEAAQQSLTDTQTGYERGQYNQLAVLESREMLFDIRETYLNALRRYAEAKAQLDALTRPAKLN
ncbi:TolC family protein [Cerasicoccus arenae]|uniref:Metal transporter n=1 Tax=Cerasicoccus arenae TaxID=424488 RepID=A0A8J3DBG0_9BACT|nr:TolC family protein [Cerasicoccus arenae]MBK1859724.1 TolC family protein [Cerasicoccus arenae]GHC05996.1 metal transporter [Cerasicoccus arenae]